MGGGERYTEQFIAGLRKKDHDFTLVSSSQALLKVFRAHNWEHREVWGGTEPVTKMNVLLFPLTAVLALPRLATLLYSYRKKRGTKNLICLSLTDKLLATDMACAAKMRVIWVEHLIPGRSLVMSPYRWLYVRLSRLAEIVATSEAIKKGLVEIGVPEERITVIHPGIGPTLTASRHDPPIIGCVSRLHKEKNVGLLIRAFADVANEVPEAELHIYGDGEDRIKLERLASSLGVKPKTRFFGWVDSRTGIYDKFSMLAVPSLKESFGIAALEAMARGLPVVATKVGGLPELVADNVTGFLTEPDDPKAMSRAIIRLIRDRALAERLGGTGRTLANEFFSEEKMLSKWESLLNA